MFAAILKKMNINAQTAVELAIFGSILILVIGIVINYALVFNYGQESQMVAFRKALELSREYDAYETNPYLLRRSASVAIIADRQMPDLSNAFGIMQRSPAGASASATYNHNLQATPAFREPHDLPVVDLYINGEHFFFTTAGFAEYYGCPRGCDFNPRGTHVKAPRIKAVIDTDEYDDPSAVSEYPNNPNLWWKWYPISDCSVKKDAKYQFEYPSCDVDCDGKDEYILDVLTPDCDREGDDADSSCYVTGFKVVDYQLGDIDFTVDDYDKLFGATTQGLLPEGAAESEAEGELSKIETTDKEFIKVKEGKVIEIIPPHSISTTTTVKKTDIITRVIQLNPKLPVDPYGNPINALHTPYHIYYQTSACGRDCLRRYYVCLRANSSSTCNTQLYACYNPKCQDFEIIADSAKDCFYEDNDPDLSYKNKTCYDPYPRGETPKNRFYIRSNLKTDKPGTSWEVAK